MRFKTEQEGLQYIKNKEMPDPWSWNQRKKECQAKVKPKTNEQCLQAFEQWVHLKRFMFSPEDQIALIGIDHRNRKGMVNQALRNHQVNTFVDWAEERPRRRVIIIVNANQKQAATQIAKAVDIIGGDQTFAGLGLSETGEEPATHFWCNWNCSASEYDFFEEQNIPWWKVYDGALMRPQDVLAFEGLKQIQPEPMSPRDLMII